MIPERCLIDNSIAGRFRHREARERSRSIVQRAGGMGRQAIKVAAAGFDIVARPEAGVVILAYHRIGGRTESQIDLPANTFADQLGWLVANSRVVALEAALSVLGASGVSVEGDLVVLTFDDGTSDWVELVLPALVEHDVPATFYVSTEQVENGRRLPDDALPVSWPGLAELVSTGLGTIGSHTHTHRLLDRVDRATAAAEIDQSIALIEDRLTVRAGTLPTPRPSSATRTRKPRCEPASTAPRWLVAQPTRGGRLMSTGSPGRRFRSPTAASGSGARRRVGCGSRRGCGTGSIGTATPAESLDSVSTAASLRRLGSYPTRSILACHRDRTASR